MKVLLTTHQFLPDYCAGTEVLTASVARELRRRGHEVRILTGFPGAAGLREDERFDTYTFEGFQVYRFHHAYVPMGGERSLVALNFDNALAARYFGQIADAYAPDIVHFFHLSRLGSGLIDECINRGLPACLTPTDFWVVCNTAQLRMADGSMCHGPSSHASNCIKHLASTKKDGVASRLIGYLPTASLDLVANVSTRFPRLRYPYSDEVRAVNRRLHTNVERLNRLRRIVAPTRLMTETLVRHGVDPDLIVQAGYGIDLTPHQGTKAVRPASTLRVGFIGTLAPHKGCHVLIEAFNALPPDTASLHVYGSSVDFPDYARQLRSLAGTANPVEFKGTFPNSEIGAVLAGLDVLVVPSLWYENTPLVLHSAAAGKRPVVASDLPGLAEVVTHEVNGLLFENGIASALTRSLLRLAHEPGLLQRLSDNCLPPRTTADYVDDLMVAWESPMKLGVESVET